MHGRHSVTYAAPKPVVNHASGGTVVSSWVSRFDDEPTAESVATRFARMSQERGNRILLDDVIASPMTGESGQTAAWLSASLKSCSASKPELQIVSDGGSLAEAFCMADIIRRNKRAVTGKAVHAKSAAAVVWCSCAKRLIASCGIVQFHRPHSSNSVAGPSVVAEMRREMLDKLHSWIPSISRAQFARWIDDEQEFDADAAVAAGLAHGIG